MADGDDKPTFYDVEPAFCCCEFIDRHGQRAHLSDAGACDRVINALLGCEAVALANWWADVDDRLRLPQYGGAVHVGLEGFMAALLLPILANIAAHGPWHALAVVLIVPPAVILLHLRSVRMRRRSRFFPSWTACSFVYGNLAFTILVGEHVHFGLWVACAALQLAAASCASTTRTPPPGNSYSTCAEADAAADEESGEDAVSSTATLVATEQSAAAPESWVRADGAVRCAMSGVWVVGYDHYCIWLDTCIGAHNLGVFARGCLALTGGVALQGVLCARHARARHVWGAEAVLALYAVVLVAGLLALLTGLAINLSRGVTAYEVRLRRRRSQPVPPMRCGTLATGLWRVCVS